MNSGIVWEWNAVTILLLVIVILSVLQGVTRGATGSMRHLFFFVMDSLFTFMSLFITFHMVLWISPYVQRQFVEWNITIPSHSLAWWEQMYYTFITGIRDFALLRFAILFMLLYLIVRMILAWIGAHTVLRGGAESAEGSRGEEQKSGIIYVLQKAVNWIVGAVLGSAVGIARAFFVILVLFAYVTLQPDTKASDMIQASSAYRTVASRVIEPLAGDFIAEQLPVFTSQVEKELGALMQRKYEVIDNQIPADIEQAALEIIRGATTDEDKARRLYDWIGSRVQYDWDKARQYETKRIWKEQGPEDTFASKQGVCIDYARLYAVMARVAELDVKVVTGLGYNGNGGYGPHAWNEVWLREEKRWIPLDATWASSGDWFDPPKFDATHIPDKVLSVSNIPSH